MGRAADFKDLVYIREDEIWRARVYSDDVHGSRGTRAGAGAGADPAGDGHLNAGTGKGGISYSAFRPDNGQEEAGDGYSEARYLRIG